MGAARLKVSPFYATADAGITTPVDYFELRSTPAEGRPLPLP